MIKQFKKGLSMKNLCKISVIAFLGVVSLCSCKSGSFVDKIKFVNKIKETESEKRQMEKFPVKADLKEIKFVEAAPELTPDADEKKMGFVLFKRSIMDPVFLNTVPLPEERLTSLKAFAAKGEFEPLCFSVYPIKKLHNFKVRISSLKCGKFVIPKENIRISLLTYWNVRYPTYNSRETYKIMPELLERVTVDNMQAKECHRYWITVKVPENIPHGIYSGEVTIAHDHFEKAVSVPMRFRVLPFSLLKDPDKHYSAYNYDMHREADHRRKLSKRAKEKGVEWIFRAARNEYKAMVDYGLDRSPTLYLDYDMKKKAFYLPHGKRAIKEILAAGMRGPFPIAVTGMGRFYYSVTGGKSMGGHSANAKAQPCPDFYKILKEKIAKFEEERKANKWPVFIYCPLDEIAPCAQEYGVKVYKLFKNMGLKTYATKSPEAAEAASYAPYVDVWCSGRFVAPFKKAAFTKGREYWCYPNRVVDGFRKYRIRARGGRMTYGFGFWKSGYSMLVPWIWRTTNPDYLSKYSSCGNQFDEDGNFIPAYYWECYREGVDDLRYIYTLKTAIARRKGSNDAACRAAVEKGRKLLQQIWDIIPSQKVYVEKGLWDPEDFNAIRWRIAEAILKLYKYPELNNVFPRLPIVDLKQSNSQQDVFEELIKEQIKEKNVSVMNLGDEEFSAWRKVNSEGTINVVDEIKYSGKKSLRFDVLVDHEKDGGGEKGSYKVGWPRFQRAFPNGMNMAKYDYLMLKVRASSPTYSDDYLSFYLAFHSKRAKGTMHFISHEINQNSWESIILPVKDLIEARAGKKAWECVTSITFGICESNYLDKAKLRFYIDKIELLKFNKPVIGVAEFSKYILCPQKYMACAYSLLGGGNIKAGMYSISASLMRNGKMISNVSQDASVKTPLLLPVKKVKQGKYNLQLSIQDRSGKICSEKTSSIEAISGPFEN
jgi:glycosyl hydrolase family 123